MSVTQGSLTLAQEVPSHFALGSKNFTSTSDYVVRRVQQEIPPLNDITFDSSRNEIIFEVSSNSSFLDLENFFISGVLNISGLSSLQRVYLEKNGVHSLFSEIQILIGATSVSIDSLRDYNSFTATEDAMCFSASELSNCFQEEMKWGNEFDRDSIETSWENLGTRQLSAVTTTTMTFNAPVVAMARLNPGDEISLATARFAIKDILSDSSFTTEEAIGGYSTATNYSMSFKRCGKKDIRLHNLSYEFCFKPRNGFLRQKQYFPLFLLARGIHIVLHIDPNYKFKALVADTVSVNADIPDIGMSLSKMRAHAIFYDAAGPVVKEFLHLYTLGKGLVFPFQSVMGSQKTITSSATTQSIQFHYGVRSGLKTYSILKPSVFESDNQSSRRSRCLSAFPSLKMKNFQYKIGAYDYPVRRIEYDSSFRKNSIYQKQRQIVMKKKRDRNSTAFIYEEEPHNGLSQSSFPSSACGEAELYPSYYGIYDSTSGHHYFPGYPDIADMIMVACFDRDPDGYFAGVDLSVTPLQFNIEFAAPMNTGWGGDRLGDSRVVHNYLVYQSYAILSESGGAQVLW